MTTDGLPIRAKWIHNGDECVAEVGKPLKWRSPIAKTGRFGIWKYGRNVIGIDGGRVYLDPTERDDGWNLIIECGNGVVVEFEEDGDE